MIYFARTANELCIRNGQTQVVCQTRSMMQSKGHFHLRGFGAVMLLRPTITVEKTCRVSTDKCPQRVHPIRVWTEAECWNGESEFCLPERLNAFLWQRFLIPLELFVDTPEDRSFLGLAFALQGLVADSQISSLFSCSLNKACFQLIRAPTPMGRCFTPSDIQLNWSIALKRILQGILKWNYWDDTSRDK